MTKRIEKKMVEGIEDQMQKHVKGTLLEKKF